MKIRQKVNNLVIVVAIIALNFVSTGVKAFAADAPSAVPTVPVAQNATSDKQITPEAKPVVIPQKNAYAQDKERGFKYAIFKFLLAMAGVLLSSLAIFAGLKFYKKIVLKSDLKQGEIDYDKTLESPKNFKEAINLFLHKTRK